MKRRLFGSVAVGVAASVVSACGSGATSECLSTEVGEVCAVSEEGAVTFNGNGLEPGSQVSISAAEVDAPNTILEVDQDGELVAKNGEVGFLSFIAGIDFTFTVTAVDENGEAVDGEIVIST